MIKSKTTNCFVVIDIAAKITQTTKHYKTKTKVFIRVVYVSGYMETEAKPNASPKTPVIEVYYTSRSRFGDKFTEIDSEGYFCKMYPTIPEVKAEWKQVPSFAIMDMITDNISNVDGFLHTLDDEILHTLFVLMNDYDTNILAGYDNNNEQKMDNLQAWVQENQTHTSMSVNDVIAIDGVFYLCDDIGWFTLAEIPLLGNQIGPIDR